MQTLPFCEPGAVEAFDAFERSTYDWAERTGRLAAPTAPTAPTG